MSLPQTKKSLGQHWLEDTATLQAMVQAANIQPGDVVLEIGPGAGTLTAELVNAQAEVVALEFDQSLIPALQKRFGHLDSSQFHVEPGDIRTYDLGNMPDRYKIVANIPYYLTANLLRKLTDDEHKPAVAALLVQKEVAERVAATPGNLSAIAVFAQFYYEVTLGEVVPAYLFTPPPKIDSQILILAQRSELLYSDDPVEFFRIVKAGFSAPRKKLRTSLSGGLSTSKEEVESILHAAHIDSNRRAQELSLDDWHNLTQIISNRARAI